MSESINKTYCETNKFTPTIIMLRLSQLGKLTTMEQKIEGMYKHQKNCMLKE